ncbi:putative RNA-binding protein of the translin family [Aciduliprofundum sp. MAR08-339]|uniref:RNA-binding protein n=1 Tax=Aciduliprofundum sp. (strain MAR08-339) TaxID=673860 RepID=UPI0002A4AA16|nr:putative RNA-binding protein of the translin family [Aciduliprofundum sp. MAR08-339]
MSLEEIGDLIEEELDDKDSVREIGIKSARVIIRLSSQSIIMMHRGENVDEIVRKLKEEVWHLKSLLVNQYPDLLYSGFVQNALQEYCEAMVFRSILRDEPIPSHRELGVNPEAYIMGMGDVVGELRREVLESLRNENFSTAEKYLSLMESIYEMLMRFNYPSGLVPLKPKQDTARSLIEKTRSEITIALMTNRIARKIEHKKN